MEIHKQVQMIRFERPEADTLLIRLSL